MTFIIASPAWEGGRRKLNDVLSNYVQSTQPIIVLTLLRGQANFHPYCWEDSRLKSFQRLISISGQVTVDAKYSQAVIIALHIRKSAREGFI